MISRLLAFTVLTLSLSPFAASAPAPAPLPRFTVTDLGTLPGGQQSVAYGLNDRGQVVGWSDGGIDNTQGYEVMVHNHAVLWDQGKIRDLGLLKGFPYSAGQGINNQDQIAGGWDVNYHPYIGGGIAGLRETFLWQNGNRTLLRGAKPFFVDRANAINDSGQIAAVVISDAGQRAAIWSKGTLTVLSLPPGFTQSYAYALNGAGSVVGWASKDIEAGAESHAEYHACLWHKGTVVDLGTLSPGSPLTQAYAVNDRGQIVGATSGRGFLWQNGKMREIPPLGLRASTHPNAINNKGQVVGEADNLSPKQCAFLWQNDVTYDLNALIPKDAGWVLEDARAINAKGQIVGWGEHDGHKRAFLLTPGAGK